MRAMRPRSTEHRQVLLLGWGKAESTEYRRDPRNIWMAFTRYRQADHGVHIQRARTPGFLTRGEETSDLNCLQDTKKRGGQPPTSDQTNCTHSVVPPCG